MATISIPLDIKLSPVENAQRYYKDILNLKMRSPTIKTNT